MSVQLPIDEVRQETLARLQKMKPGERLVLSAPTGSGKSTRLPLWCREAGHDKVLVIEPRRLACRALATWVAATLGEKPGQTVGFGVRREQCQSEQTKILFVTPGVARRMLSEQLIGEYSIVIFDEFHERSWETDSVMAVLAAAEPQSSAPRLLLMSATLTVEKLASVYGARTLESSGRSYPVEISHDTNDANALPSSQNLADRVAAAIKQSWTGEGRMLVFLPGLAAMQDVRNRLLSLPVRLLHGTFTQQRQDHAFAGDEPGIILATNVAESSLTVPGVTAVVDSGLEKRAIHQAGYVALATVPISAASADQRAGRAGRTAPGTCLRLWGPRARLETSRPPDLERMELDDLLLFLASLQAGISTPCVWLDPPPSFAWDRAKDRLTAKDLIDVNGRLTALGLAAEKLPVDADWARILAMAPVELRSNLCDLHAFSSARRSWVSPKSTEEQSDERRQDLGEEPWGRALSLLRRGDPAQHGLDPETLLEAQTLSGELWELLGGGEQARSDRPHPQLKEFLARHWPERHFVRRESRDAWANGTVECRTGRGDSLPEECQAAVFLRVEPILGRGLKVDLRGNCSLPLSFSELRRWGYGSPELSKVRWRENQVVARIAWTFAGRVLSQTEETLEGAALRKALVELCQHQQWKPGLWANWESFVFYESLQESLAGQPSGVVLERAVEERLERLGLEAIEDLELLDDTDLQPDLEKLEGHSVLEKTYPRQYHYGGVSYDALYYPERRKVTLRWRSGPRGARPNPTQLPRWNGWAVEVDERGRVTPLRG